jgi:Bacterial extracellular solute-binding protein/von Willebrand factor type A domain
LLVVGAAAIVVAFIAGRHGSSGSGDTATSSRSSTSSASGTCSRSVSVVVASSVRPVLDAVAATLGRGTDCLQVQTTVADGAAAVARVQSSTPDAWIADDASWSNLTPTGLFNESQPTVLATSPLYAVLPRGAALPSDARSWDALSTALSKKGSLRLALADPAVSGTGMVAASALSLAVFAKAGPLISALDLMRTWQVAHTAPGPAPAWPSAHEVGFASEQEILHADAGHHYTISAMQGQRALTRVAWSESKIAVADPSRAAGLQRLLSALTSAAGQKTFADKGFRGPADRASAPPESSDYQWPATSGEPFPVTPEHFMFHVLTTWHPDRRKANILVVVDVSGSMADTAPGTNESLISLVSTGVGQLTALMPGTSHVGLWEFGSRLDGSKDYRQLVANRKLDSGQRSAMKSAARTLAAQQTGTGLYDTILAAYRAQQAAFTSGMPTEVLVFTDGHNQDDPNSISLSQLKKALAGSNRAKHVQIGVLGFGNQLPVTALTDALSPVGGQVDSVGTAEQVIGAFVHAVSGGLTH